MCSHHHHSRGEKIFSEWSSSTAARDTNTVYTSPPPAFRETGEHNAGSCTENIFRNICCAGESVECASAFGDNHNKSCGTLTTMDSSFKCVSTLNGRITCAVLLQPCTLKCVNTRCRQRERQATPGAAAASSIQDQSETEAPTTEVGANNHIDKHLKQSSFVLPTNTIATSITTTSWASTPSVRSPSVLNFEKCITAEEKSTFLKNFLAKNPPLDNLCNFVQSEFVLNPINDIFCFNLRSSSAIEIDFLQNLLSKSFSHFYHPKKIFIIICQNLQSQWLSRAAINAKCSTSNRISLKRVQKCNYIIPSVCNISNVFLIIHNEVVNNSNENVNYFSVTTQSSVKLVTLSSSVTATAEVAVGIVSFKSNKKKSFEVVEETENVEKAEKAENATDDNTRVSQHNKSHKVCDDPRCQTSPFYSIHKTTTSPTSHFTLSPQTQKKASHSLFKVSDVQKQSNNNNNNNYNNKTNRINSNNNNEQQRNISTIPSNVSYKKNSHLVEDGAFKASQRLKRLEENFKGLTFVRKIKKIRQLTDGGISVSTHNFSKNQLSEKTKSSLKGIKGKNTGDPLCKRDSIKVFLSSEKEQGESFTTTSIEDNDIIKCNDRVFQAPIKNNYLSNINNNCNSISESGSLCDFNISKTNRFKETTSKCFNDFYDLSPPIYSSLVPKKSACCNLEKKDILYINRPVPSISEFDVRQFSDLHSFRSKNNQLYEDILRFECYDELLDDNEDYGGDLKSSIFFANDKNDCNNNVCNLKCQDLYLEEVENPFPIVTATNHVNDFYKSSVEQSKYKIIGNLDRSTGASKMRETNGQLRGLLKKPNRPPPVRKNRVVFDETRNEFFEADYIILIREDCAYDEEDEEPCTCGEHELVRLCCEEGCQCNYTNENTRTPQSPKFAPPIEFVDEAALSPPDDYKDNGLKNSLSGALSGHIFGAQHIQQLQVIQRLQQQRAAMLAARNNHQVQQPHVPPVSNSGALGAGQQTPTPTTHAAVAPQIATATTTQSQSQAPTQLQIQSPDEDTQPVCTECAECVECAAKQLQESERTSPQCQEEVTQLSVPTVALVPLHNSSPERRITQKEIIAGEERPKYILQTQFTPSSNEKDKNISVHKNPRFVVESITMTTVTERRIVRAAPEDITTTIAAPAVLQTVTAPTISTVGIGNATVSTTSSLSESTEIITEQKSPISPKDSSPTQISGILKGGKLWKQESISQSDDVNTSSEDDTNIKRSVRFVTEDTLSTSRDGDGQAAPDSPEHDSQINDLIPIKKHSTLFTNALRPNSAMRQLFPTAVHQTSTVLTHEALRAFDESKRAGNLLPNLIGAMPGDSDTVRRNIERNILRRSLIKKKVIKSDISLEERIKQLTCDIDESNEDPGQDSNDDNGKGTILNGEPLNHRGSPTGEENPQQKYSNDKSFSPSSSVSSSSSGSSSAYKKISDIFNRDRKQEKIVETEENPIVIIPQECRCPAAPDLGMGIQVPVVHTQIHRTPPRQAEPKRQFLSTLAPLTACVAGQKDDLSYYTLAAAESSSSVNTHFAQYNMGDIEPILCNDEMRKVAPDVIAGTPGQEQDELAAFAQQEAIRTEKIKKRYSNENSNVSSDDDEQNDYGFNKRPSVRGIKPKFSSTNEILQQMQDQLNKSMPSIQNDTSIKSYTLPKQASSSSINKQIQNVQPQNPQIPAATAISQQQTERTWSFYGDPEQQRIPIDGNIHPGYYHTMPTVFQQTFQGQEETLLYQNCVTMEQHYGRYARSPTRRPESPPPLRNYHQTMVLIPYNAETYSQFAATSVDPKVAQIQRQNILEYQQVTQQTIRVPISYALPAMQLHVVAGRGQATQQYTQHQPQLMTSQQPSQRILGPRYSMPQDDTMGFSERGVPEGAAAVSHTDCKGIVSPTTQANQPQQQQQHQQMPNCNQSTVTSTGPPGSVFYTMNV